MNPTLRVRGGVRKHPARAWTEVFEDRQPMDIYDKISRGMPGGVIIDIFSNRPGKAGLSEDDFLLCVDCYNSGGVHLLTATDFSYNFQNRVAHIGHVSVYQENGHGMARQLMLNIVEVWQELGMKRIDLEAQDVGGYAWAKFGFVPEYDSFIHLVTSIGDRIKGLGSQIGEEHAEEILSSFRGRERKYALWKIADDKTPVVYNGEETTLGKALLISQCWNGYLDFADEAARARFNEYTGANIQSPAQHVGCGGTMPFYR